QARPWCAIPQGVEPPGGARSRLPQAREQLFDVPSAGLQNRGAGAGSRARNYAPEHSDKQRRLWVWGSWFGALLEERQPNVSERDPPVYPRGHHFLATGLLRPAIAYYLAGAWAQQRLPLRLPGSYAHGLAQGGE